MRLSPSRMAFRREPPAYRGHPAEWQPPGQTEISRVSDPYRAGQIERSQNPATPDVRDEARWPSRHKGRTPSEGQVQGWSRFLFVQPAGCRASVQGIAPSNTLRGASFGIVAPVEPNSRRR